ncbi:Protein jagged-1 [Portunus trituberculatus]|uniref:Protein jagged-1 n=1 Tax=Portunus trituberculatus TaxID=210409 RepID=A0A5B7IZE2_PORTR|nr:Protein jagged-1 [Portunus trituberculatus]
MVGASGRFELEVVEVQNPRSEVRSGKCCGGAERPSDDAPCPSQCRTVVALCLKEYQSVAVEGSKAAPRAQPDTSSGRGGCTYGEDTSVVLGLSSFTLTQSPPTAHIQLPFTFSWTRMCLSCGAGSASRAARGKTTQEVASYLDILPRPRHLAAPQLPLALIMTEFSSALIRAAPDTRKKILEIPQCGISFS